VYFVIVIGGGLEWVLSLSLWRTTVQFSPRQRFSSVIDFVNMPSSLFHRIGFKGGLLI
jgi:hypothetical protein